MTGPMLRPSAKTALARWACSASQHTTSASLGVSTPKTARIRASRAHTGGADEKTTEASLRDSAGGASAGPGGASVSTTGAGSRGS
eukprot:6175999-Prymnesium_polylepis.1